MDHFPKDRRTVSEFFTQVWGQALVTVSGAEDEASKLLARLQEVAGWSQDEGRRQLRDFTERLVHQRRDFERRAEETIRVAVSRVKVPRREEIAQLNSRLDTLTRRVESLSK
jgi:polyhydroxyalkanoate synthesis regulator phasin